ncbi:MAG: bifunctional heptose 7-phosphate kinase/heptose 1-phosphate adenyltransferase [Planctomycetota bacterium]
MNTPAAHAPMGHDAAPGWGEAALARVDRFSSLRIGVLGDLIADLYTYGRPVRLSREAPVMIVREEREELIPGGAANTIANLRDLGATVIPVGVVGDDAIGERLLGRLVEAGVDCRGIRVLDEYRTVAKTRLLAGDVHTVKQQVVRIDREPNRETTAAESAALVETLERFGGEVDAWIVSDYGYAAASPAAVDWVRSRSRRGGEGVPTVAASRYRLGAFHGFTVVTPNESEFCEAFGLDAPGEAELLEAGFACRDRLEGEALLVTRGNRGMMLIAQGSEPLEIPIHGSDDIVDVSGAGDTVASVLTLALAAGAGLPEACRLANVASGLTVMKRGAATITPDELRRELRR